MKNKLFLLSGYAFLICFLFSVTFGLGFYTLQKIKQQKFPVVHVFFEPYATNPAFSHMIEFAQLPPEVPKIIAWHRFPNRQKILDLKKYNTTEIKLSAQEGRYTYNTQKVLKHVIKLYKQNPQTKFVFYANLTHQNVTLAPFLRLLPKKNIHHIHLFEDGYGELFKRAHVYTNKNQPFKEESVQKLPHAYRGAIAWETVFNISTHKLYPTTYHLMHADKLSQEPRLNALRAWWRDADIKPVDFEKLSQTMSETQKQIVYKLSGFEYDKFCPLIHKKPTLLYTFGYLFDHKELDQAQMNLLYALRAGQLDFLTADKPYQWLYKSHPNLKAKNFTAQVKTLFPDMIEIPAQVPYEVFILAGCKPAKTAGYSSSLFYSLKADDVLAYVRRSAHDTYLKFLRRNNIVRPGQVVDLINFTDDSLKQECDLYL